jgi:hypothetical protein
MLPPWAQSLLAEEDELEQQRKAELETLRAKIAEMERLLHGPRALEYVTSAKEQIELEAQVERERAELGQEFQSLEKERKLHPPPEFAEYLLWYLPKESRENIIGDLEEDFRTAIDRFGRRKAIAWYYYQVGASFWPVMTRKAEKLLKWGVLGWIGDLIHRVIA